MNICIVAGARPNFIKVAPLIHVIERLESSRPELQLSFRLVYTGREDDPTLEGTLFEDLQIAKPSVFLGVDCENLNELTGQVMTAFEHYLQTHPTDVVIVVDDLASTMAVSIVTKKQGIRLAHIAAGTRSFDIKMPKEINRLVIDGLSDVLFTAGISNNSNANRGGTELSKVYMVGNILMDTLRFNRSRWKEPTLSQPTSSFNLQPATSSLPTSYIVFTLNRKALIADEENLKKMVEAVIANANGVPVIAPLRGKAANVIEELMRQQGFPPSSFIVHPPLSYLEFGWLTAHAMGIITDSGNVAEEATFNGVPCITLNSYTEHIETVKEGTNVLVGEDADLLGKHVADMVHGKWKEGAIPDRWDGRTAERILQILME